MVSTSVSNGAPAPQHDRGLLAMLDGLDEASAKLFLTSAEEGSGRRLPSPITGLLLYRKFDPVAVVNLVNSLWPGRLRRKPGSSGPNLRDRLPLVCFLLPKCDPAYGPVFNVAAEYRRLKADKDYRRECGYVEGVPSESTFNDAARALRRNWERFQACILSEGDSRKILSGLFREVGILPEEFDLEGSDFTEKLQELGWEGNLPPLYRSGERFSSASQVGGGPRGADEDTEVSAGAQGDAPKSSGKKSRRNWSEYNYAQTNEEPDVKALLGGFCQVISRIEDNLLKIRGKGRPGWPLGHVLFAVVWKTYTGKSSRRLQPSLREAAERGYLGSVPLRVSSVGSGIDPTPSAVMPGCLKFNTVSEQMRSEFLTPLLLEMVSVTATPFRSVETVFAMDATGLSTRIYGRWLVEKPGGDSEDESSDELGEEPPVQADTDAESEVTDGNEKERHDWMKLHALYGAKTMTIVRAAVSSSRGADNSFFEGLVSEGRRVGFNIQMLAVDKAYSDRHNYNLAELLGFRLLSPFKKNSRPPSDDSAWSRALKYSLQFPEEFWRDYFVRNISEAGFSAMKRLFTAPLLSKSYTGLVNEALCRVIAYNLIALAREMRKGTVELNIPAEAMALVGCIREVIEMQKQERKRERELRSLALAA